MDGGVGGWLDGWMDEWMEGRSRLDKTDRQTGRHRDRDGGRARQVIRQADGGETDRQMFAYLSLFCVSFHFVEQYPRDDQSECTLPSTRDVKSVIVAAFRLPAGRATPILSSLSRRARPPFLDFALQREIRLIKLLDSYLIMIILYAKFRHL